jgi:protein TonB
MKTIWTLILMTLTFVAKGQSVDSLNEDLIITYIEVPPSFPGGQGELMKYIDNNLRWLQGEEAIEGQVIVEFWIKEDGQVSNVKILRGLCETCDKEALRIVTEMPAWTPATQKGRPLSTRIVLPIHFGLRRNVDSSIVFGGSKRGDFKRAILELRRDGTGKYICWLGPHGWAWRDRLRFQWEINNDSLRVKLIDDKSNRLLFSGVIKGKRLLSYSDGPFGIIGTYYLVTRNREKAIEKLKEDGE